MNELVERLHELGEKLDEAILKMQSFEKSFESSKLEEMPQINEELTALENETIAIVQELLECERQLADVV